MLDLLLADAAAGRSRVTVLRGEAGVGKSALLGYLSGRVAGWHVARAAGVESEMELAYAGLHQLCAPMLDHLDRLPAPQDGDPAPARGRVSQQQVEHLTLAAASEELGGRAGILTHRRPPCLVRRPLAAGISRAYIRGRARGTAQTKGAAPGCLPGAMPPTTRQGNS